MYISPLVVVQQRRVDMSDPRLDGGAHRRDADLVSDVLHSTSSWIRNCQEAKNLILDPDTESYLTSYRLGGSLVEFKDFRG